VRAQALRPSLFTVTITTDNAAFCDAHGEPTSEAMGAELARILRNVSKDVQDGPDLDGDSGNIRDLNGNKVGIWEFKS
jgi:hypothetical protein